MADENHIAIYTESARDPESGHVFWFAKMVWKKNENYFLHLNGIHSGENQDITTTDGGILDAIANCLQHLERDAKYDIDIITKKNRISLNKSFVSLENMNIQKWMIGKGVGARELPDVSALKKLYNMRKKISSLNFLSHPEDENVRQMDLMARTFREAYYLESGREPSQIISERPKIEIIQNQL